MVVFPAPFGPIIPTIPAGGNLKFKLSYNNLSPNDFATAFASITLFPKRGPFGIGISKMAIAWKFKHYKNAVFIDIGCGMSALAGTCGIDRPYFGSLTSMLLCFKYFKSPGRLISASTTNTLSPA